jgi:3-hydroxyacyl-[acyl-carrier-protein] dehydratase
MLKSLDICEILKIQKNKYPLLFIDKVTKCIPGKLIISQKNFTYNEWYFPSHFEDEPNVPGFIQIESLVQSFILTFLTLEELRGKKTNFFNLDKFLAVSKINLSVI